MEYKNEIFIKNFQNTMKSDIYVTVQNDLLYLQYWAKSASICSLLHVPILWYYRIDSYN